MKNATKNVNGSLTLGENIADIGAVQLSYQMYQKAAEKMPSGLSLPGHSKAGKAISFGQSAIGC